MSNVINFLQAVRSVITREGEREFAELNRRSKREIFNLFVYHIGRDAIETDGDKDGCFALYRDGDVNIVFFAKSESAYLSDIRDGLTDMYVDNDQSADTVAAIDELLATLIAPINVINLTPHEVVIVGDEPGVILARFPASGDTARVMQVAEELPPINGVPVVRTVYGSVDGLPEPTSGTVYIVSIVVAQAIKDRREDVLVPDTGPVSVVRDGEGKIVGVRRLMRL